MYSFSQKILDKRLEPDLFRAFFIGAIGIESYVEHQFGLYVAIFLFAEAI